MFDIREEARVELNVLEADHINVQPRIDRIDLLPPKPLFCLHTNQHKNNRAPLSKTDTQFSSSFQPKIHLISGLSQRRDATLKFVAQKSAHKITHIDELGI
jgi:hypothetical protein